MILFHSGSATWSKRSPPSEPENVLKEKANVMLSYFLILKKGQMQDRRLPNLIKLRKRRSLPCR